jgi:hypothetical protein
LVPKTSGSRPSVLDLRLQRTAIQLSVEPYDSSESPKQWTVLAAIPTDRVSQLTLSFPLLPHIHSHDASPEHDRHSNHLGHDAEGDFGAHRGCEAGVRHEIVADAVDEADQEEGHGHDDAVEELGAFC